MFRKYIEAKNHGLLLRGSDNQRILILNTDYRDRYTDYLKTANSRIQNFSTGEGIISVGIHQPGYENVLEQISRSKGLEVKHERSKSLEMASGNGDIQED